MTKKYLVILSRINSEHDSLTTAKAALAKVKLKKDEVGVIITPKGERKNERSK